ncbi:hypothetical protein KEM54_005872 [Ascosphaera aggregata]|nr:hypothetical protein KEM54_005872 [Ascosphaera aggregata]
MSLSVERRVFHCILDDSALTTNISEIKKWAISGAITLFVPLYTIERLRAIKFSKPNSQIASNAGQALKFLDRATSGKYDIPQTRVVLQGPLEQFEVWEDAQKFFLPEFEEEVIPEKQKDGEEDEIGEEKDVEGGDAKKTDKKEESLQIAQLNEMSQMLLSKLNIQKISEMEPVVDNDTSNDTTATDMSSGSGSHGATAHNDTEDNSTPTPIFAAPPVPEYLKPLLSCVLWQLHNAPSSNVVPSSQSQSRKLITPLKSWVLITNDWTVRNWAAKYGIQVKTIHQLRTAILYEDKEYKNHVKYMERNQVQQQQQQQIQPEQVVTHTAPTAHLTNGNASRQYHDEETDTSEDELVFIPRGPKLNAATTATTTAAKPSTSLSTPRSQSRQKSNSRAASGNGNTPGGLSSTPISITDSSSLLEAKSSPVVEIPSSPIDPDSFSRNIVVTRSPMSQTQIQGQGQGQGHGHGRGHGQGHGHGSYGRGGVPHRGPKTPEQPASPAQGFRGPAGGRGGLVPSGPRRRGGGSGGRGGGGNGMGRGFGGIQRGRGRLWVP